MTDRQIIGIRLAFATIMLNNCLKFTECSRCKEFLKETSIGVNECPYTTYLLKNSLKDSFKWCWGRCSSKCEFIDLDMQTNLIKCSVSYVFYKMCSKYKDILG